MSWSIQKTIGTPVAVKAAVAPEFDRCAAQYAGKQEEQDVLAAKIAVLTWLDQADNTLAPGMGVQVEANGSRGDGWVTIAVNCIAIRLLV